MRRVRRCGMRWCEKINGLGRQKLSEAVSHHHPVKRAYGILPSENR